MSTYIHKPRLFVTPHVLNINKNNEFLDFLEERFNVRTSNKPIITRSEFLALCENQDAILASAKDRIDEEVVKATGGNLKVVSLTSAGYDQVNTEDLKAYGVRVGLAGHVVTNATAEFAVALLLCSARQLIPIINKYKSDPSKYFKREALDPTLGLENSTVGIIGAGRIGQSIARKLKPFNIKRLLYSGRNEKHEMKELGGQLCSLEDIAEESDYIVNALPHNAETDKLISRKLLNLMKPNAIIVNIGRGGTIDQDALVEALQKKKIGGAALDVTTPEPLPADHPLLKLENAMITPHVGYDTSSFQTNSVRVAIRNIIAVFDNEKMPEELIL